MPVSPLRSQILGLDLDRHLAIDAGAGTGKTTVMSMRYTEHLLETKQRATVLLPKGPRVPLKGRGSIRAPSRELTDFDEWHGLIPTEVVAITFTNKAADELRQRIRDRLSNMRDISDVNNPNAIIDPRLRKSGDVEQLISLLEDAPIGTIDGFISSLVSPHLSAVSDDPAKDLVSDAQRPVLLSRAINTAWRLQSEGQASLAGVGMDPSVFISARNRLAWLLGGRGAAERMLMAMLKQPLFVEEAERQLRSASGGKTSNVSINSICSLLLHISGDLSNFAAELQSALAAWLDVLREHPIEIGLAENLGADNRISHLNYAAENAIPEDGWDLLQWIHHVCWASMAKSNYDAETPNALPKGLLPTGAGEGGWPNGLNSWGSISANSRENAKSAAEDCARCFRDLLSSPTGKAARQYARMAVLLHPTLPVIALPEDGANYPTDLPLPLPRHMDSSYTRMPSQLQANILDDLFSLQRGVLSILNHLKLAEGVYDHSDMQRFAEDLLLARCPDVCRNWYPSIMVEELDNIGDLPWLDGHILRAISCAPEGEDGQRAREDLERRFDHLKRLRRRYRAFIIDEYQDTNPQQFRLLSRLWGRRKVEENEPAPPEGPWDPTVCLVGDIKQSIYRFRQAQVTVMERAIDAIKSANSREDEMEERLLEHRQMDRMRDPRPIAGGKYGFAQGTEYRGGVKGSDGEWKRIDLEDDDLTIVHDNIRRERALGHIDLTTNFRTAPNVLGTLNTWFSDIFDERHDLLPGNWHARSQPLKPPPLRDGETPRSGRIEWMVPVPFGDENPSPNLNSYLDPFTLGERAKPYERENEMIAARLHALVNGLPLQIRNVSNDDDPSWREIEGGEIVRPEDILILVPRRKHVSDMLERLRAWGVPAQADRQGDLFSRPIVRELNKLLQILARPFDRHHAAAFARGCFVGMSDSQLELFLNSEDFSGKVNWLSRLLDCAPSKRQRKLLERIQDLCHRENLVAALNCAVDVGDSLIIHPSLDALQDAEQFINLVSELRDQVGGDHELVADSISILSRQEDGALESKAIPPTGAVRVMTIHSAKGLEAPVVVLAGLFHEGHFSSSIEKQSSVVVTPELLAVNARPWGHVEAPLSGTWELAKALLDAQTAAERRRLFYVALTRVENHLILVGAPKGSSCSENGVLELKRPVSRMPSMGEMWLDALRRAAHSAGDQDSPWADETDTVGEDLSKTTKSWMIELDAGEIYENPHLGGAPLENLVILHDPRSFSPIDSRLSIVNQMEKHLEDVHRNSSSEFSINKKCSPRTLKYNLAAHSLDSNYSCKRRMWLGDVRGWSNDALNLVTDNLVEDIELGGLPSAAMLGTIFHRLLEVGIGNPANSKKLNGLDETWLNKQDSKMLEPEIIKQVLDELLPANCDRSATSNRLQIMAELQETGSLGKLCEGHEVDGKTVTGLRTELPFNLTVAIDPKGKCITQWTIAGEEKLADVESICFSFNGRIDLALAIDDNGEDCLQVVDTKTDGCGTRFNEENPEDGHPLQNPVEEPYSMAPQSPAERQLIGKHRLQLALYTMVLERMQLLQPEKARRRVLPPAIQVSASGRLISMSEEDLIQSKIDFVNLLDMVANMKINPHDEPERLDSEYIDTCKKCPYYFGEVKLCGPKETALGVSN